MRILQVNKFNYPRGGADAYFLFLQKALADRGHEVAVFAMEHPLNEPSPWEKYFVSRVSFNSSNPLASLKAAGRTIYSLEAAKKFAELLADFKPDIIHCHNIYHHLSPSILVAAKKRGIPVVMHLHDYKLVCPNYRLYHHGQVCCDCLKKKNYWSCLKNNCYESWPRSFLAYSEMTVHHKIFHFYENDVDQFIAPSKFMADLIQNNWWPSKKITTLINPAPVPDRLSAVKTSDYFLYFGRLVPEKGVEDLVQAAKNAGVKLHLAGVGPLSVKLKGDYSVEVKKENLKFLGQVSGAKLRQEIEQARAVVIPSRWLENMPLALLESLSLGKIVIASDSGGMVEIIKDRVNGYLFKMGDIQDLEEKIRLVAKLNEREKGKIIQQARKTAAALSPGKHLNSLVEIYLKLVKKLD